MKIKTLIATVAVLAVLSAIAYWTGRTPASGPADARVGKPLADSGAVTKAAKIRISDQGKSVLLVKQADGSWRDAGYFDMTADFSKLSSFVSDLLSAKIDRLVTTNPARIARLEFKDTKIELLDGADKVLWAVTLGKNADSGGRFVRFGNEDKAYLASLNAWIDGDAKNWADAQLLHLKADDVAKVEIPFDSGGAVTVQRAKKDAPWTSDRTPAGQEVKKDRVASLLDSLDGIRFSDSTATTDADAAEAKAHLRTFRLTTFDGKTLTVALGRKPEEKKPKAPEKEPAKPEAKEPEKEKKPEAAPEMETIPAGPVFVFISSSDAKDPINALMEKRAFKTDDYTFTGLPQKADELFEAAPPPPKPAPAPAPEKK
jgi:hypothetical protein